MSIYDQLHSLRLFYMADHFEQFIADSLKSKSSIKDALIRFIELESLDRSNRSTARRLKASKIGKPKLMNQFDWNWPKEIDRSAIEELMTCEFIKTNHNVILINYFSNLLTDGHLSLTIIQV